MNKKSSNNLFQRLTRLFKSGPVIKRKIKTIDTTVATAKSSAVMMFQRSVNSSYNQITANAYNIQERLSRYQDFNEMESCLSGDTKIAVPGGYKTLLELVEEYGVDKPFIVYAYDHEKNAIIPAWAKQARQTSYQKAYKVTFDNGKTITGDITHRLMKRDGTYARIGELQPGDAMMPFIRRELVNKHAKGPGYQYVYTISKKVTKSGWRAEHKIIAEFVQNRCLNEDEVVHHVNFVKSDNRPENLQVMTSEEHKNLHRISAINYNKNIKWADSNSEWIENFKKNHSEFMKNHNHQSRNDITFAIILQWCDKNGFRSKELQKALKISDHIISSRLKEFGFESFTTFAKAYDPTWKPYLETSVTVQDIYSSYKKGMSFKDVASILNVSTNVIGKRLRNAGYGGWKDFASRYENCKVVSIEEVGEMPLYDLTVDGYKNFATDSVISHNTAEINSALDIYADETCLSGDTIIPLLDGTKQTIKSLYEQNRKDFYVNSYDVKSNRFVPGRCLGVTKTSDNREVFKITFDDGIYVRLTENHLVLLSDNSYCRVENLKTSDSVKAINIDRSSRITSIQSDGFTDVYDLEVETFHNFAITGDESFTSYVMVHNCAQDEKGRTLHVSSNNPKIKSVLEDLFYNTLNVEFNLRPWTRNLCKYGDVLFLNDVSPDYGVINVLPIPVNEIEREEGYDPEDPMAVRFRWISLGNKILDNWQITHMRLLGNDMYLPYGSSVLEGARRIWRQLILIEDAMLVYRIVRSPERRVFYIDVGNTPPDEIPNYIEQAKVALRSNQVIDNKSGRVDLRYNPVSVDEDFFIPTRGTESGTKIDTLAGGQNTAAIEDVEYIQRKLFAALKIPKAYLGYEELLSSKATLAMIDIRFSRTINMIQRTVLSELNKIAIIHLYANGFSDDDLLNFTLRMSNPSTVAQQQKLELFRTKFEIAGSVPEGLLSRDWIRKNVIGLTEQEIIQIERELIDDAASASARENAGAGGGGGSSGGMGGGGGLDNPDGGDTPEDATDISGPPEGDEPPPPENAGIDPEIQILTAGDDPLDDKPVRLSLKDDNAPIRVQNQLQKTLYNRSRHITHGSSKTHMPDFTKMLNPKKNRQMNDPFDSSFLRSQSTNPLGESKELEHQLQPSMSAELYEMLQKMNASLKIRKHSLGSPLLVEEINNIDDVKVLIDNGDDE